MRPTNYLICAAICLAATAACVTQPLGDPATVMQRLHDLQAEGDTEGVAVLGGRAVGSREVVLQDRADTTSTSSRTRRSASITRRSRTACTRSA
jgi:hypothetical protein